MTEADTEVKYPDVSVVIQMSGPQGNAFFIMGAVTKALRRESVDEEIIKQYMDECTAGDYDNLLAVTEQWVVLIQV